MLQLRPRGDKQIKKTLKENFKKAISFGCRASRLKQQQQQQSKTKAKAYSFSEKGVNHHLAKRRRPHRFNVAHASLSKSDRCLSSTMSLTFSTPSASRIYSQ